MNRCVGALAIAAASLVALPPAAAHAAQTRLWARADTYVNAARPHHAYGDRRILRVSSSPPRRAYLRFAVPALRTKLTRARLQLSVRHGAGRVRVQRVPAGRWWSERRTTYARAPRAGGRAIRSRKLRPGHVVIDVTRLVRSGRNANLELSGGRDVRLWSRESKRRPVLVVDSSPAPAPAASAPPPPPPAPSPSPVIAAAGDIACAPGNPSFHGGLGTPTACAQKRTSDLLIGGRFAAILALGDNQYDNGTLAEFQGAFDPSWGRLKPLIHPVAGNHEYGSTGAAGYFDYFDGVGATTGPAGPRGQGYYSFNVGSWHLIALNSNCTNVGGCGAGSAQEQWLAADLRAHPAACTLAYWHHPLFTSGNLENDLQMATLWSDLQAAGADLVLAGHAHIYERFAPQDASGRPTPNGIREFVVGTGGEDHLPIGTIKPNSQVRDDATFGILELTLGSGSYGWRFVPEAGATFTDRGAAACH